MKILLKASCTSSDLDWCRYALVDLDKDGIAQILNRRDAFVEMHSRDTDLSTMTFWGCCDFYDDLDTDLLLTAEQQESFDRDEFCLIPDSFSVDGEVARTECERLVIMADYFLWSAIPKHSDVTVETRQLNYDVLALGLTETEAHSIAGRTG